MFSLGACSKCDTHTRKLLTNEEYSNSRRVMSRDVSVVVSSLKMVMLK